jgi:hypothetical protein
VNLKLIADVRFEVFTAVTMKNAVRSVILVTLMMGAILSTETSVLTRATGHNIPEDGILRRS